MATTQLKNNPAMTMFINSLMSISYYIKKMIYSPLGCFIAVVIATVLSHWVLVNTYVYFCAPPSVWGALQTLLSLGSPMCHFINSAQLELAKQYITIWSSAVVAIIAWIASKIKLPHKS
jgi:hypothetical protein